MMADLVADPVSPRESPGPPRRARSSKNAVSRYTCLEQLLSVGVRIFEFEPTLLHQKIVIVDDE
jgi:phosphatidylserine/phosphatidylglycerophosphate/cardiolipin synthase-like enzyme